ncbi:hypothetical protein LTR02_017044 [Friedmanniomyces endolithicus]|uniref:Uncharacterized protein n=1 Tax=Friedmanniomyces endolithicus TaxID=329885 RepID=A0A4U0VBP3_9PEZI|nr:hypothetical protein LTS09_000996 [Friedmanniomyces endolithicus]KAK0778561.1 hypothetical protein LTR75_015614 [Friedmanniomyces endolithicus]KAK0839448.1 hypothetical protein LTR03_011245 [Friedmanniomyces endolithicus]KAK0887627.1 hypothetical protein LTR02_017044 [Friedmanniomyces endolithicus]KAK1049785.1 hypothetical protein LTR33_014760 [Friedmanniomyces endolithicus]
MPGAGKQAPEVQAQIKELLEAGFDPTTIHRKLKVGRSSIYRMKRCLQQHGTTYMPSEMNKKNGRPKVLTAEQELGVREWLRDPKNRNRYLDDLVWLIHDRFGIVCSTTTMSKLKRKWTRVIESEESGEPLEDGIRAQIMETHPNLPLLENGAVAPSAPMTPAELEALRAQWQEIDVNAARPPLPPAAMQRPPEEEADRLLNLPDALREQQDLAEQMSWLESQPSRPLHDAQVDERQGMQQSQRPLPDQSLHSPYYSTYPSQVGAMVEHQLQREMGLAEVQRAM